ncbi:N-acetylmuramoyl-L-alanine amidase [Sporobacter termitidis DSM 10068]|uniref:N-acetylmuramoyl-L-alanine amidase n=1 Tax=Sporobacter termitidis DSM 10068 TaxID=1123282 RepID=A0A1M5TGD9_9FIRM|nr:N-acetylmuramoyl-L-alanine amidase [Sporobacter termitidis]SHH49776.1 N-acetylmuramoyl-L-alanine amidase [Sporobacter termitidis DSM 10068]
MRRLFKKALPTLVIVIVFMAAGIYFFIRGGAHDGTAIKASAVKGDLTVIVDAGHGGADGGAVSLSGVKESAVNIDIATRLDLILGFFGTHVEMTRTSENLEYSEKSDTIRQKKAEDQSRRLKQINSAQNAVLISIHQNIYPSSGPFGAQVLYAPTNGSKEFGAAMQQLLIDALNPKNKRTADEAPDNILLMNHITCPALLIECGFLSNPEEEKLLMTDTYRTKIAAVIAAGYLANRENLVDINSGGTNEGKDSILLY